MMFLWRAVFILGILEIAVFLMVIDRIGFFKTMGLWLISAVVGGFLVRSQGLVTLAKARTSLEKGIMPVDVLFESLCLIAAGALFILPGFLSDILAFVIMTPFVRDILKTQIVPLFGLKKAPPGTSPDGVIEGTYERVEEPLDQLDHKPDDKQGSPWQS